MVNDIWDCGGSYRSRLISRILQFHPYSSLARNIDFRAWEQQKWFERCHESHRLQSQDLPLLSVKLKFNYFLHFGQASHIFFLKKDKVHWHFFSYRIVGDGMRDSLNDVISCVSTPSKLTLVIRNSVRSIKLDSLLSVALWPVLAEDKGEVVEEDLVEEPPDEPLALDPGKHRRKRA